MRVFKTRAFARWARREGVSDRLLRGAVADIAAGLVDADLGGGVYKKRLARPGQGKRGGYRVLLACRRGDRLVFIVGFAKKDQDNLAPTELAAVRQYAATVLDLGPDDLDEAARTQALVEIDHDQKYDS